MRISVLFGLILGLSVVVGSLTAWAISYISSLDRLSQFADSSMKSTAMMANGFSMLAERLIEEGGIVMQTLINNLTASLETFNTGLEVVTVAWLEVGLSWLLFRALHCAVLSDIAVQSRAVHVLKRLFCICSTGALEWTKARGYQARLLPNHSPKAPLFPVGLIVRCVVPADFGQERRLYTLQGICRPLADLFDLVEQPVYSNLAVNLLNYVPNPHCGSQRPAD